MNVTAVIMAGGKGERFWPKSRKNFPKQFLSLSAGGRTMIQLTAERLLPLCGFEDIFVVTNRDYVGLLREQLPEIPEKNILAEPMAKNTAPCIGLAATAIGKKYDDALMLVLPSDHLIINNELYINTLKKAIEVAACGENLVTIGITPTYPETGYGYIRLDGKLGENAGQGAYKVKKFVEKPDYQTAVKYLSTGQYLWNSGIFVWKRTTIMRRFQEFLPDTYHGLMRIGKAMATPSYEQVLHDCFSEFKSESIDYSVMEHASHIYTIPGNFGWDDVGSWTAMERIHQPGEDGNVVLGDAVTHSTRNSIIVGSDRLIATVGVENVVIVDAGDAVLICAKDEVQNIKKIIEKLKKFNRSELL